MKAWFPFNPIDNSVLPPQLTEDMLYQEKTIWKTKGETADVNPLSVIILSANGWDNVMQRQWLLNRIKTRGPLYAVYKKHTLKIPVNWK